MTKLPGLPTPPEGSPVWKTLPSQLSPFFEAPEFDHTAYQPPFGNPFKHVPEFYSPYYSDKVYNPIDFGAKARGNPNQATEDSSQAIQKVIDLASQQGGGLVTVHSPNKHFDLHQPLKLRDNVTLSLGVLHAHNLSAVMEGEDVNNVSIHDTVFSGVYSRGIKIWCKNLGDGIRVTRCQFLTGTDSAIDLDLVQNIFVYENLFVEPLIAVLLNTSGTWNSLVSRNTIIDPTKGGLIANNSVNCRFIENSISNVSGDGVNTGYAMQFYRS